MKRNKQIFFSMLIALGMSVFSACGGDRGNSSTTNNTGFDNGNATGTVPQGDMTDTTDLRDSSMMDGDSLRNDSLR